SRFRWNRKRQLYSSPSAPGDDLREALDVEARATDERTIHIVFRDELGDIVRLHASPVEKMTAIRGVGAEPLPEPLANVCMRLAGLRRRRRPARPDRPYRLVGDNQLGQLRGTDAVEALLDLSIQDRQRLAPLALLERLADADDWREPSRNRRARLPVDDRVALAEQPPALGVSDD